MKVLLTGGAGFIASHIAEKYIENGFEVFILDKKPQSQLCSQLKDKVTYFQQDLTEDGVDEIFSQVKPDIVNHHTALISVAESENDPISYSRNNVLATVNLLKLSQEYKVKQFIFASSVAVYGDVSSFPVKESFHCIPKSIYGQNKYSCENYTKLFSDKFKTTIFRYANVYGPRQNSTSEGGVVSIFANNLINTLTSSIYGDGSQTRDFVYVKDIASANLLAIKNQFSGLVNISTNTEISISDLYKKMRSGLNINIDPIYKPERVGDIKKIILDNNMARILLKWKPKYSLEKGLNETLDYFKNEELQS